MTIRPGLPVIAHQPFMLPDEVAHRCDGETAQHDQAGDEEPAIVLCGGPGSEFKQRFHDFRRRQQSSVAGWPASKAKARCALFLVKTRAFSRSVTPLGQCGC